MPPVDPNSAAVAAALAAVPDCAHGFRPLEALVGRLASCHDRDFLQAVAVAATASPRTEVRMMGALCCGVAGALAEGSDPRAFALIETGYAEDPDWRVREVAARAFDTLCRGRGYHAALPVIRRWLAAPGAGARRAVSEGLRPWTGQARFGDAPELAVALLAPLRTDPDDSVRLSAANALADIGRRHPEPLRRELAGWDLADRRVAAVARRAGRHLKPG
jgi:HEAT repeat protein